MSAAFLLLDMDTFYASVEQARRSDLRGQSWQRMASHAYVGSSNARS
jgi:nucleotidyltransferase/DNA polymerase involved in DNA repair